jgi:hypothetical protein
MLVGIQNFINIAVDNFTLKKATLVSSETWVNFRITVTVTGTEMHNEIEHQRSVVLKHEAVIRAKNEVIEKLVRDASQQAKVFCKLSMDSMYAFILVIY